MTQVEVYEVFCLVSDEASEVSANDAVPSRTLALIEGSFDMLCDILLDGVFTHRFLGDIDSLLLHVFGHICRLDLRFELVATTGRGR